MTSPGSSAAFTTAPPGFRLPPELGLGRVRLEVADLSRSVAFYEKVLGLETRERRGGSATLGATGDPAPLVELQERPGARPVPRRGRLGLYHFAILLPTRAALGRFVAHLEAIGVHAGMSDHLVSEAVYLTDPDGLGIEVYADRPPSTWRVHGNDLAMAVDPLNVEDLLQAAGEEPWSGAPAGTRMGHVHLHVGGLDQAEAFYHRALGFEKVTVRLPGALFLSAGGYHHHLGLNTWAAGAPPAGEGDARLLEWTIEVPGRADIESAARSLAAAGHVVTRERDDAVAADPWGTAVRVALRREPGG
jgi:catechol 2,3-dioxygenase